jgi:hypothetical protein
MSGRTSTSVNPAGRAIASSRCEQSPSPVGVKRKQGGAEVGSRIVTRRVERETAHRDARVRAGMVALRPALPKPKLSGIKQ